MRQKKNGRNIELEVCNPTKPRHRQANSDRAQYYVKLEQRLADKKNKKLDVEKDIWQEVDFRDEIPGLKDEKGWISRELALHTAGNIGKKVVKLTLVCTTKPPKPSEHTLLGLKQSGYY